ncbi:MAG: diaminopimelate epimerase [Ignavibacteria bacterium]|nr:diaminopimelate epimerase [Ignavibacteria bacterium]
MIKYSFTKMNGAGNDFIALDYDENPPLQVTPELIRQWCDRRFGIGADGVITIRQTPGYDFAMEYFNADGSGGTLCGNGARCATRFAVLQQKGAHKLKFTSNGVEYRAEEVENNEIRFYLPPPATIETSGVIETAEYIITSHYSHTGSPHVVIFLDDIRSRATGSPAFTSINDVPVKSLGREIRYMERFPHGTNVNFVAITDIEILIRTYERGVEDETLACGTGSTAAAVLLHIVKGISSPVCLKTRSGCLLNVAFESKDGLFKELSLQGPAEVNFRGEIEFNQKYKIMEK